MTGSKKSALLTAAIVAASCLAAGCGHGAGTAGVGSTSGPAAPTSTVGGAGSPTATGSSGPSGSSDPSSSSHSAADTATTAGLADGRHPANVTAVDAARRRVTIDVVQFFTGKAAQKAAHDDGAAEAPNDYYIRNASPRLRTLGVVSGASVTVNVLAAEETGSAVQDVPRTLAQLGAYKQLRSAVFWITVRGGKVTAIKEMYLP